MKLTFAELRVIRKSLEDHKRTLEYYVFERDDSTGERVLNKECPEYAEYEQLQKTITKIDSAEF